MHRRQPCHSSRHGKNSPSALFINYVEQHGGHFTVSIQTHQLYFLSPEEVPQHVGQRAASRFCLCHRAMTQPEASLQSNTCALSTSGQRQAGQQEQHKWEPTIILPLPGSRAEVVGAWRFHLQSFLIILLHILLSHDACKNLTAVRLLMYYEYCLSCWSIASHCSALYSLSCLCYPLLLDS